MSFLSFILGPAVGAVIGGITNRLAITMLFRPYEAKHIGPYKIPLTPGIIPKEKGNIARAIGATVSQHLLDQQSLSAQLLSDNMQQKIAAAVDDLVDRMCHSQQTLQQFLLDHLSPEEYARATSQVEDDVVRLVYAKLADPALGNRVAALAVDQVVGRLREHFLGRLGAGVLELLRGSVERMLADNINQMLHDNAHQMLDDLVTAEADRLLATPISQLCQGREELFAQLKASALKAYRALVLNNLPRALAALNIQKIIEDKINAMDMRQTETMLLQLMDRELKALVWFGVLLGFIMGFVTNII